MRLPMKKNEIYRSRNKTRNDCRRRVPEMMSLNRDWQRLLKQPKQVEFVKYEVD